MNQDYKYVDFGKEDKARIIPFLKGKKNILEVGCGIGTVSEMILSAGYDCNVTMIDKDLDVIDSIKSRFVNHMVNYDNCTLKCVNWLNFESNTKFDAIVFSSVIPEIVNELMLGRSIHMSEHNSLNCIIDKANAMLNGNGVIIIRDAVVPEHYRDTVQLAFYYPDDYDLVSKYFKKKKGWPILPNYLSSLSLFEATEMLYTIVWGEELLDKELEYQHFYYKKKDWENVFTQKHLNIIHSESYLQDGYRDRFKDKYVLLKKAYRMDCLGNETTTIANPVDVPIDFPDSNILIVAKKYMSYEF